MIWACNLYQLHTTNAGYFNKASKVRRTTQARQRALLPPSQPTATLALEHSRDAPTLAHGKTDSHTAAHPRLLVGAKCHTCVVKQ